jgi:hypothetical protein
MKPSEKPARSSIQYRPTRVITAFFLPLALPTLSAAAAAQQFAVTWIEGLAHAGGAFKVMAPLSSGARSPLNDMPVKSRHVAA